jgi:sugar lactone lactonase YvrE
VCSSDLSLFARPVELIRIDGETLVLDSENHVIRLINQDGRVTIFVGAGTQGSRNGSGEIAEFNNPLGFTMDDAGNIYIADTGNHTIRKIDIDRNVTTIGGNAGTFGYRNGPNALFDSPAGIIWHDGILYITDTGNHLIRALNLNNGEVTTLAGTQTGYTDDDGNMAGGYKDGTALEALFNSPTGIAINSDGVIFIADTANSMIRTIYDGHVHTLAGFDVTGQTSETIASAERYFVSPRGLFLTSDALYVTDTFLNTVIQIELIR